MDEYRIITLREKADLKETHERIPTQPLSLPVLVKKGTALIFALFRVVLNIPMVCLANSNMKWGLIWREINIRRRHIN